MSSVWPSRMGAVATLAAVAILVALNAAAAAAAPPGLSMLRTSALLGPAAVPGEIVVGFRSGVGPSGRAAARSDAQVQVRRNLLTPGAQLVKVESGQSVVDAIATLKKRSDIRYAEPNWIYHATATTPNDPLFGSLWGLDNTGQAVNGHAAGTADDDIDAPEAWDRNQGNGTVVGVVDSGVAWDHPDLSPNMWANAAEIPGNGIDDDGNGKIDDVRGWDFVDADNNPWDYNDHGTHVAGTIAARGDNGIGVVGVAWKASIMPVRALNAAGAGNSATIADAFTYAADNGAKVVNASLGGPAVSQLMSDAITNHPNTLFVVAAGNGGADGIGDDNDTTPTYPCNYTAANLICVAATNNNDALAGFSNYGATSVDLGAPGVDTDSARPHYTDSFSDDFESGLGQWTVQSGTWGTATALGTTWLRSPPTGNYPNNADWAIRTTSKVDVGSRTDCVLKFTYGTFLQNGFDWLYAQTSTDGTTWTTLGQIGNTGGSVRSATLGLGAAGSSYYRFRLTSDATTTRAGIYIDNARAACPGGTYGSADYQFLNGTSMATPHVAGAAVVLFSAKPSATVADVKGALLASGDPVAALSTKTVTGRRLNLNAALTSLVPPDVVINEVRGSGTSADDDYVELFNRESTPVSLAGYRLDARNADGSAAGSDTLPAQTIAPRGTLLVTAPGYSLGGLAGGDDPLAGGDVPAGGSLGLFSTANTLLDSVHFAAGSTFGEGSPLGAFAAGGQYAFVRRANRTGTGDAYGLPTDTGDNGADFSLVVPQGATASAGSALPSIEGVPGPRNLASAPVANAALQITLLDPGVAGNVAPNRQIVDPDGASGPLPQTLYLRRTATNISGVPLSRLQFRVTAISTARSDPQVGQAIVRLDSSDNTTVAGKSITPLALERSAQTPLPHGGGLNAVVSVPAITPATQLAPGASINVEFALRIAQTGAFQVILNTESQRGS